MIAETLQNLLSDGSRVKIQPVLFLHVLSTPHAMCPLWAPSDSSILFKIKYENRHNSNYKDLIIQKVLHIYDV